jgi:hypothetical protein
MVCPVLLSLSAAALMFGVAMRFWCCSVRFNHSLLQIVHLLQCTLGWLHRPQGIQFTSCIALAVARKTIQAAFWKILCCIALVVAYSGQAALFIPDGCIVRFAQLVALYSTYLTVLRCMIGP